MGLAVAGTAGAMFAGLSILERGRAHALGLLLCTLVATVLSPLIEPRYFIVPVAIFMAHIRLSPTAFKATLATMALVNALTIYVFLYRSFTWPDGSVARFMW